MAITENKRKAVALYERKLIEVKSRLRKTQSILEGVYENKEVTTEYFKEVGEDGVREILASVNAIADSNQLDYILKLTPEQAFELLVTYTTKSASDPKPETMTLDEVMIESLRWSERLNRHPDSPFAQNPRFALIPTPTGNVSVGDEINTALPLEEDEPE